MHRGSKFDRAKDRFGSKAVNLRSSICFRNTPIADISEPHWLVGVAMCHKRL